MPIPKSKIPDAAVRRLPVYLRALEDSMSECSVVTSSVDLSARTGFTPEQIRKDLAYFGAFGTRGVGYDTALLARRIRKILGLSKGARIILVGVGNLGTAFARYNAAFPKDVRLMGAFDADPDKFGHGVGGLVVRPAEDMYDYVQKEQIKVAVLAVPSEHAQGVAEGLERAGIEAILNFTPVKLRSGCYVQNIDLSMELQSLVYYTTSGQRDDLKGKAEA